MNAINPYQPIQAKIEDILEESPTIKTFVLKPEGQIEFEAGQFVEISIPGLGEAPFTPSSNPKIKQNLEITIMNVGTVTSSLHQMNKEEVVGIRGPLGSGYPLDEFKNKEILIVGGGVGIAPLRSLLFTLFDEINKYKKVLIRYGARTPADIVYKSSLPEWGKIEKVDLVTTVDVGDESWKGKVGLVTTILEDLNVNLREAKAIVCGPPIMMKFVTFKLLDKGFKPADIYLSMEKNMSCGLGMCGHCRLGRYYVCRDGPVFSYGKIKDVPDIWD